MLPDEDKPKEQLINELAKLRQRNTELATVELKCRQAETILSAEEESYQRLFELFPIGVTVLDMKGVILYSNSAVYSKGGHTESEFTGKHFSKIASVRLKDIPIFIRVFNSVVRGKIPKPFEAVYQRKDGTTGWTELNISLIKVGRKRRILVIQHDISERKQAEEKLQQSEERYRVIFEDPTSANIYFDTKGRLVLVNQKAAQIIGKPVKDIIGKHTKYVYPARSIDMYLERVRHAVEIGETAEYTDFIESTDKWFLTRIVPIWGASRTIMGAQASTRDITEQKKAEEALWKSEQNFRNSLDSSPLGIRIVTAGGELLYANQVFLDIYGYGSIEELKAMPAKQRYIPQSYTEHQERKERRQLGKPVPSDYEISIVRKDGEVRHLVVFRKEVIWDGETQFQALYQDITERKRAEKALRQSAEKLRLMFESATEGITVTDLNGNIVDTNEATVRLHGFNSKQPLIGRSAFELIAERDHAKAMENLKKTLEEGPSGTLEYTLLREDGSEFPGELSAALMRDTSGNPAGFVALTRDITERKEAEEEIKSLAKFQSENPNPVLRVAKDGTILYANKMSLPLLGVWKCQVGQLLPDYLCQSILDVLRSGVPKYIEVECSEQTFSFIFAPVVDADYVNLYGRDITERKEAERREKELQRELNLSSRLAAIGELAAGVAHEINNPLTGILGFSERLMRKSTDEEASRDLERIHNEAKRAAKVMENLLTFARPHKPKKQYADINDILQKALELRAYELKTSNIKFVTDLSSSLPKTIADFQQIQEVFLNIILNAEQAMTEANRGGKLVIKTQKVKDCIRVSFADDGAGIPAEHLDKVFDPFFTTRGEKGGTGLGLSVCHGIVIEHGGTIYAKSKLGHKTTFFVELPPSTEEIDESKVAEE
ncbi:PAS domain S-box protein [Chloroflexota bacterium]